MNLKTRPRRTFYYRGLTVLGIGLAFLAAGVRSPAAQGGHDWPMWDYDAARSGASPAALELPDGLHLHWVRVLPAPRRAWPAQGDDRDKLEFDRTYAPVVSDGRVFVASMNRDRLTAYAADTGVELWRFYAGGPMRLAPAVWDGRVYAVSDDGLLYALDAETGAVLWIHDPRPSDHRVLGNERVISMWPARGGPVVLDDRVYFAAGVWSFVGCGVYALDAVTGALEWQNTTFGSEWLAQPHRTAYAFAGLVPQGYLAASENRLVVAGGRALPGLFDRHDGRLLHHQIQHRAGSGGYRVRIEDAFYFNHGERYLLETGYHAGSAQAYERYPLRPSPERDALAARLETIRDRVEGTLCHGLVAANRLFAVTREGVLYAFGAAEMPSPVRHEEPVEPVAPADTAAGRLARDILGQTGVTDGYGLVLGGGDGALLEQLAVRSRLHLVVLEADAARVAALRRRMDRAGLYGSRIAILRGTLQNTHYPSKISSLIVAADPAAAELSPDAETLARLETFLRPYDGRAWIGVNPSDAAVRAAVRSFRPEAARLAAVENAVLMLREGPLPGAGRWTHQHADPGQSVNSDDHRVRLPLGPIWFGGPSNEKVLPRHAAGPRPQVAGGRLVILGVETISARCVYTGRELWVREFAGIGHPFTNLELEARWREGNFVYMTNQPGATYIGSPYVSLPDAVYLRYRNQVVRLDPRTGETEAEWPLPVRASRLEVSGDAPDWGHLSVVGDQVIVTTNPHIFRGGDLGSRGEDSWDGSSSERIAALDRHTGAVAWIRDAEIGFRHNAIASGNGMLFVNDLLTEHALQMAMRRGLEIRTRPRLYALDVESGEVRWSQESDVFGTFLSYSVEHDILVEGASHDGRFRLSGEPGGQLIGRRGRDGHQLWRRRGRYSGPVILHDETIIPGRPGVTICLRSGEDRARTHPVTGDVTPMTYWKSYGCGSANASPNLLLFRSGAAGFTDLEHDGGTGNIGGFKSGCTASMIAADGVLNAPDYTRTCVCSYQNQTSLGLVHMPEMEVWTVQRMLGRIDGRIERLGLNIGAPGDRRADNGTVWMHVPQQAPSPDLEVRLESPDDTEAPVYVVSVEAGAASDGFARHTLDDDPRSFWQIACWRTGGFSNGFLTYAFDRAVELDRLAMAWSGPPATEFVIEVQNEEAVEAMNMPLPLRGWRFRTDPGNVGDAQGWHDPAYDDGAWGTFEIGRPWTEVEAYADYIGPGWYRHTFPLPDRAGDADPETLTRVELTFEGVDESARIWINGTLVGAHDIGPSGWDQPFAVQAADAIRWGEVNQVTVRVLNTVAAGGIWRPVTLRAVRGGWRTVFEGEGRGRGWRRHETYRFSPVAAQRVRIHFVRHGDEGNLGRATVYSVRFGDLPDPESYAFFIPPRERLFRKHALRVAGGNGLNWVAASGMDGIRSLLLRDVNGGGQAYDITLHFSEPNPLAPGERRFAIRIGAQTVVEDFDVAAAAGGVDRAVTLFVPGMPIGDHLQVRFTPAEGSVAPPLLSGLELIRRE